MCRITGVALTFQRGQGFQNWPCKINMLTWHNQKWIIIVIYFAAWLRKRHLPIHTECCYKIPSCILSSFVSHRCALYEQVTQGHCQLADPQVQWVGLGWSCPPISVISKVIFSFTATSFNKRSIVLFCYSNPVISTATVLSSSTNHHHRSISYIPVTPEADLVAALDVATTLSLLKPVCCLVLSAVLNRAASQAPVAGPNFAISKVAITCYFRTEGFSIQAVPCCLQQWRVTGIITACDLKLSAFDHPKCLWEHVSVSWRISCCSSSISSVIPPVTTVFHPIFAIIIWEPSNQQPARVTVALKWEEKWGSNPNHVNFFFIYSYFEKGCRKKCTRQSRKALWVILSLLFFKEIWKNWYERPWKCVCEC